MSDSLITLLLTSLTMSLICMGIWNSVKPGRIFGMLGEWAQRKANLLMDLIRDDKNNEIAIENLGALLKREDCCSPDEVNRELLEKISFRQELYVKRGDLSFLVWFLKPIILCPPCFASVWGSIAFWIIQVMAGTAHWSTALGLQWALAVFACAAINAILHQIQLTLHD